MAGESLASCEFFGASRLTLDGKTDLAVGSDSFLSLICIDGDGSISFNGEAYPFTKGDSYFLPAGMGAFSLNGAATLIASRV
jgi:mannose-6-phosphate isomerase